MCKSATDVAADETGPSSPSDGGRAIEFETLSLELQPNTPLPIRLPPPSLKDSTLSNFQFELYPRV